MRPSSVAASATMPGISAAAVAARSTASTWENAPAAGLAVAWARATAGSATPDVPISASFAVAVTTSRRLGRWAMPDCLRISGRGLAAAVALERSRVEDERERRDSARMIWQGPADLWSPPVPAARNRAEYHQAEGRHRLRRPRRTSAMIAKLTISLTLPALLASLQAAGAQPTDDPRVADLVR